LLLLPTSQLPTCHLLLVTYQPQRRQQQQRHTASHWFSSHEIKVFEEQLSTVAPNSALEVGNKVSFYTSWDSA
jgi:hypothetical protein